MHLSRRPIGVIGFLCVLLASPGAFAQFVGDGTPVLGSPQKESYFLNSQSQGMTPPFFSHGYFIQFSHMTQTGGGPNIYLFDLTGKAVHQASAWPAGTARLFLSSVDVTPAGQLAFAGQTIAADGSKAPFIATSDLDGNQAKYFSTESYLATRIAAAADGSIWTAGDQHATVTGNEMSWSNYDTLRHYSANGLLLEHYLPRWGENVAYVVQQPGDAGKIGIRAFDRQHRAVADFAAPLWGPEGGFAEAPNAVAQTWLRSVEDGVVLYDGRSGVLYRFSASHATLTRYFVDSSNMARMQITGFAATSEGQIFASMRLNAPNNKTSSGLFALMTYPSSNRVTWLKVQSELNGQDISKALTKILGQDGLAVVYKANSGQVFWSEVALQKAAR